MNKKSTVKTIYVNGNKKYGKLISEIGVNRLLSHGDNGMIIISANRSEIASDNKNNDLTPEYEKFLKNTNVEDDEETRQMWLNDRNKRADNELKEFLRRETPYAYTATYGGYHGGDGVTDVYEPSYVVYNYDRQGNPLDFDDLRNLAIELCGRLNQDSVYVKAPNEPPVYLDANGKQVNSSSSNDVKINRDNEMFYTTNKRDKNNAHKFTSDIRFESLLLPIGPGSLTELRKRLSNGEYLLEDYKK